MSDISLKISGKRFDFFNSFELSLEYNSFASTFSFEGLIINDEQKQLFKPLSYSEVQVIFKDEVLLTGTALNISTSIENQNSLGGISGYSLPGIFEDCEIPISIYPVQFINLSLKQITEKIIKPFGIKLIIDSSVSTKANKKYEKTEAKSDQKIKDIITELANQRNIIVTHDESGNLLFTQLNLNTIPVAYYYEGMPSTKISLEVNGQGMHSEITVLKQTSMDVDYPGEKTLNNTLITVFRPTLSKQSAGDNADTENTAEAVRASELRNITLTIETNNWVWSDGKRESVIKPNQIIEVLSPSNFINEKTKWFVESVTYSGNENGITATINCVLPETYSNKTPKIKFE